MSPLLNHVRRHPEAVEADALLAASGHGDYGAFAAFYDRTAPMTFGLLRRGLDDPGDALVAMERVYMRLWRTAPHFERAHECSYGLLLAAARREFSSRRDSEQRERPTRSSPGASRERQLL